MIFFATYLSLFMQTQQGFSPIEVEKTLLFKTEGAKGGPQTCLSSHPPPRKTIKVPRIEDCHPGLLSHRSLGEGAFGQVESVTLAPSDSNSSHGNLYSGLEAGKTYALKHFDAGGWVSPAGDFAVSAAAAFESALQEICVGEEAGKMGVGPKVFGAWFCKASGNDFAFVLMEQLQMSVDDAIGKAEKKNLIFTPDAQRSLFGLKEKFFMGGYDHVDNHFGNAGVDMEGRFKLLDFGIVRQSKWEVGKKATEQEPKNLEALADAMESVSDELTVELPRLPYFQGGRHRTELVGLQIMREVKAKTYVWGSLTKSSEKVVYPFPKNEEEDRQMARGEAESSGDFTMQVSSGVWCHAAASGKEI
uniref:Protein kinase domain-containing protein n=1 Tax=Chromera velia CCMP2878 TaxID=1169474 RepID=A0A0G4H8Q3_9ALVE|eukprot:Cvel_5896.t1-p1 / transcript=Cvel_5896.t1 / gene=Cvel_5896 / organism=Chromera_velia_CCMP2878 / gene_product=hypothetical protein / transcript_product=hypothetical protein / location=Cvel_scaffold281:44571-45647(-) / protein_length=359 / sequence_SO=supercontig / SO=protein_coding / is_pseudo=false